MADQLTAPEVRAQVELHYSRVRRSAHRGWLDIGGMAYVLAGALVAAIAGAALFWAGVLVSVPILTLAGGVGQGVVVGLLLAVTFRWSKLGHKSVMYPVAIAAGFLSMMLVYEGLYIREAYTLERTFRRASSVDAVVAMLKPGPQNPIDVIDKILVVDTGHAGVIGYLKWRMSHSRNLGGIIFTHTFFTVFIAFIIAKRHNVTIVCPFCGDWLSDSKNLAVFPTAALGRMVDVVGSHDTNGAVLLAREFANAPLGSSCAVARQFTCSSCRRRLVDVISKSGAIAVALPPREVSEEFANALRSEAAIQIEEPSAALNSAGEADTNLPAEESG